MASRLERLMRIYNRLRRGPVTIEILHSWTKGAGIDISQRQLYRDLQELCALRFLEDESVVERIGEKNQKIWQLIRYQSEATAHQKEWTTTYGLLRSLAPRTLKEIRKETMEKFDTVWYQHYNQVRTEYSFKTFEIGILNSHFYDYLHEHEVLGKLDEIIWAIGNNRKIQIQRVFHDNSHVKDRLEMPASLNPLYILIHRGHLHVCCIHEATESLLIFGVDKELQFELTNDVFRRKKWEPVFKKEMVKRFGITANKDDKVYDIELEISSRVAMFMQHIFWHPSQEFVTTKKGTLVLRIQCGINRELIGWILMWLSQMKVKKPLALKNEVKRQLQLVQEMYENNLPPNEFSYDHS